MEICLQWKKVNRRTKSSQGNTRVGVDVQENTVSGCIRFTKDSPNLEHIQILGWALECCHRTRHIWERASIKINPWKWQQHRTDFTWWHFSISPSYRSPNSAAVWEPEAGLAVSTREIATWVTHRSYLRRERAPRLKGHRGGNLDTNRAENHAHSVTLSMQIGVSLQRSGPPCLPKAFHRCLSHCEEVETCIKKNKRFIFKVGFLLFSAVQTFAIIKYRNQQLHNPKVITKPESWNLKKNLKACDTHVTAPWLFVPGNHAKRNMIGVELTRIVRAPRCTCKQWQKRLFKLNETAFNISQWKNIKYLIDQ